MTFEHTLRITHERRTLIRVADRHYADSEVDVHASSSDLVETWRELLSRLPSDVYAALREAMRDAA